MFKIGGLPPRKDSTKLNPAAAAQSNGPSSKASELRVDRAAQSSTGDSVRPGLRGPQKPKGEISNDFGLAHVPHSQYPLLEPFREILVSLNLVRSRGANSLGWRMLNEVEQTAHSDTVSLKTQPGSPIGIQLSNPLARASAVHIMSRNGFILDSAIKLDDGTWVFSKAREGYEKNASILFQTERNDGKVTNETLPLKSLKAR